MPSEEEFRERTEVIIIGKKRCPPIEKSGFKTEEAALVWARATHCPAGCVDNGLMVINGNDWTAVRFCKPK